MILKGCEKFLDVDVLMKEGYETTKPGIPTRGIIIQDRYSDEIGEILKKHLNERNTVIVLYDPFILKLRNNNRFLYSVLKEKSCKIINHTEQEIALIQHGKDWELDVIAVMEKKIYDMLVEANDPILQHISFE
ncbi:MAG: hypothetical protein LLF86_03905 [Nitrospiraceae bacterium]|nr:hypothetical protein [Nitrospiraceae bacterium]